MAHKRSGTAAIVQSTVHLLVTISTSIKITPSQYRSKLKNNNFTKVIAHEINICFIQKIIFKSRININNQIATLL